VKYEHHNAGVDHGSRATGEVEPSLKWPVLARLPWVGDAATSHDLAAEVLSPQLPDSALGVQDDDYHPVARGSRAAPASQRHRRFDAADARTPSPMAVMGQPAANPRREPVTLAGRMFHWHAALAPHAGIVVTIALALSAGLLYWLAFDRAAGGVSPKNALDAPAWSIGSSDPQFTWSAPLPANSPPAEVASAPSLELQDNESRLPLIDEPEAAAAPVESAEATEIAKPEEVAAAAGQPPLVASAPAEPLTPTPSLSLYPTTPYRAFDFGAALHAALAPQSNGLSALSTQPPADAASSSPTPR